MQIIELKLKNGKRLHMMAADRGGYGRSSITRHKLDRSALAPAPLPMTPWPTKRSQRHRHQFR